jgi:hypothetical protein
VRIAGRLAQQLQGPQIAIEYANGHTGGGSTVMMTDGAADLERRRTCRLGDSAAAVADAGRLGAHRRGGCRVELAARLELVTLLKGDHRAACRHAEELDTALTIGDDEPEMRKLAVELRNVRAMIAEREDAGF